MAPDPGSFPQEIAIGNTIRLTVAAHRIRIGLPLTVLAELRAEIRCRAVRRARDNRSADRVGTCPVHATAERGWAIVVAVALAATMALAARAQAREAERTASEVAISRVTPAEIATPLAAAAEDSTEAARGPAVRADLRALAAAAEAAVVVVVAAAGAGSTQKIVRGVVR